MTTLLDSIAGQVIIRHTCHCDTAIEQPADGQPEIHEFTVDGQNFPWPISERGPLVTQITDDLYTVNVELFPVAPPPDFHMLSFAYTNGFSGELDTGNNASVPYIPVIGGERFPWLLTDEPCRLEFGHKIMPALTLTFYARNVDTNTDIDDRRRHWADRAIWCAGGSLIKRGLQECPTCGEMCEFGDMVEHYRQKHPQSIRQ